MINEKRVFDAEVESETAVQVIDRLRWWRLQRAKEQPLPSVCYIYNNNYHNYSAFGTRPLSTEVQKWLHRQRHMLLNKEQEQDKDLLIEGEPANSSKDSLTSNVDAEEIANNVLEEKEEEEQHELKTHSSRAHSMPHEKKDKEHCTTNDDNTSCHVHDRSYHSEQPVFVRLNSDNEIVADNKMPYTEISKLTEVDSHIIIENNNNNSGNDIKNVNAEDNKSFVSSHNTENNQNNNTKVNNDTKMNTSIDNNTTNNTANSTQNEENDNNNNKISRAERQFLIQNTIRLFRRRASSTPVRLHNTHVHFMIPHFTHETNSAAESESSKDKMSEHATRLSSHTSHTAGRQTTLPTTIDRVKTEEHSSKFANAINVSESFFHTSRPSQKALVLHHPPRLVLYSKHFPLRRLARAAAIKKDDVASNELMKESTTVMHVGNLPLSSYERVFYNRQLFSSHLLSEAKIGEAILSIDSNKNIRSRESNAAQREQNVTNLQVTKEENVKSKVKVIRNQVDAVNASGQSSNNAKRITHNSNNDSDNCNNEMKMSDRKIHTNESGILSEQLQNNEEEEEELLERRQKQEEYDELKRLQKVVEEEEQESNPTSLPASPVAREGRVCILTTSTNASEMTRAKHLRAASQPPLPSFTLLSQRAKAKTFFNKTKQMQSIEKLQEPKGENNNFVDVISNNAKRLKCVNARKVQLCRYVEELQDAYVFNPFVDCIGTGAFSQVYAALPIFDSRSFCTGQQTLTFQQYKQNGKQKRILDAVAIKVIARKAKHKYEKESDVDSNSNTPNKHYTRRKNDGLLNEAHTVISESSQRRELMEVEREIGILRRLRHTGCSVFYEALRTREEFVIVMKLHHASLNLRQFLDTFGVPSERRASLLLFQLLTTVHYLHHKFGVIHRDIKLENLLISTVDLSHHEITQCIGHELYKSESTRINAQMESNFFTNRAELLFDSHNGQDEMFESRKQSNSNKNNNGAKKQLLHSEVEEREQGKELSNEKNKVNEYKELNTQGNEGAQEVNKYNAQVHNCEHITSYHTLGPTVPRTPHSLLRLTLIDFGLARRTHLHKKATTLEESEKHKEQALSKSLPMMSIERAHHDNHVNNNNESNLHTSNSYNGLEQEHSCHDVHSSPATPFTTSILQPSTSSTFAPVKFANNASVNGNKQDIKDASKHMNCVNNWRRHGRLQQKEHHHQLLRPVLRTPHHEKEKLLLGEQHIQYNAQERTSHSEFDNKKRVIGGGRQKKKQLWKTSKVKSRQQSVINRALPTPMPSTINLFTAFYDVEDDEEPVSNSSIEKSSNSNISNCLIKEQRADNIKEREELEEQHPTPYSCEIDKYDHNYMSNDVEEVHNNRGNFTASISARSSEAESVYINSDNDYYEEEDEEEIENNITTTNINNSSCKEVEGEGDCNTNSGNYEHDTNHGNKVVNSTKVNETDKNTRSALEGNRCIYSTYNDKYNSFSNININLLSSNRNKELQEKESQSAPHKYLYPLCSPEPIPHRSVSFQLEHANDHKFAILVDTTNNSKSSTTSSNTESKRSDEKVNKTWLLPASASTPEVVNITHKTDNNHCETPIIMETKEKNERKEDDEKKNTETSLLSAPLTTQVHEPGSSLPNVENETQTEHKCHYDSHEQQQSETNDNINNNNYKSKNYRVRTLKSGKTHEEQREEITNFSARNTDGYNLKFKEELERYSNHNLGNKEVHAMHNNSPEVMRATEQIKRTHEQKHFEYAADKCTSELPNSLSSSRRDNEHEDLSTWLLLTPCGTEKYLAPEMLEWIITHGWIRKPTTLADAQKLDMYAIGVVAYVLLSGCFPFNGSTQGTLLQQQQRVPRCSTTNWKNVSSSAIQFVQGLLEPDPALRFNAEEALSHSFMQQAKNYAQKLELIPCEEECGTALHKKYKYTEITRNMTNALNINPAKETHTDSLSNAQIKDKGNDANQICSTASAINTNSSLLENMSTINSYIIKDVDKAANTISVASQERKSRKESGQSSNDTCQHSNIIEEQISTNTQSNNHLSALCTTQQNGSSSSSSSPAEITHEQVNESAHSSKNNIKQNSANANNTRLLQTQDNELHDHRKGSSSVHNTDHNTATSRKSKCINDENNGRGSSSSILPSDEELKTCKRTVRDNYNIYNNNDDTVLSTIPCEYDGSFLATAQSHSTLVTNTSKTTTNNNNNQPTQMLWSADHDDLFEQLYDNIIHFDK